MSGGLIDKVYIGLDSAPAAFDIRNRILGANGTNLEYIRSETGVVAVLKGDKFEPLHLALHHTRSEALAAARSLALNLIETIRAELSQWTAAQTGGPPPAMNVPPPTLTTASTPQPVPPPVATVTLPTQTSLTSTAHSSILPPVVSVAPASTPLMTVRQPAVLQLLPQQQYVLNQENGQLIPIVQPGVQVSNSNFTSLPIAQSQIHTLQQPSFGPTQIVDISNVQPLNVTQFRLSGVPSSMSMILPNGLTFSQGNITATSDTTTVSTATSTPVVCAAPGVNSSQKILYSADKADKQDVKYHIQGGETVQWTVPSSQTMIIPYQQLQDFSANSQGLTNIQPQQFVSIAPAGGLPATSLPLSAAQWQQLQATGTIMQFNQKPTASSAPLINIISTGQASSPQPISNTVAPTKSSSLHSQESRGQKRLSDGTPTQLQLRPIAPAGSQVNQDKSASRDSRSTVTWTTGTARENITTSMGMKINPAHGTVIHVSSGQQTNLSMSTPGGQDGSGMYIKQIDRNSLQFQANKDLNKQDSISLNKIHSAQNVQMITVPPGMTVLQNPLNISQMPVLGQPNSQVYMIPANQSNLVTAGALQSGLISQQVLQPGQNVTVMQPNQLTLPNNMQYNTVPIMPMNVSQGTQYVPASINLSNPLAAQQLNAALATQQLTNPNLAISNTIPIVQASASLSSQPQSIPITQPPPTISGTGNLLPSNMNHIVPQNSYITPTTQYQTLPPQYVMQPNSSMTIQPAPTAMQYNIHSNSSSNPQNNLGNSTPSNSTSDSDVSSTPTDNNSNNQNNFVTVPPQQSAYPLNSGQNVQNGNQQSYPSDSSPPAQSIGQGTGFPSSTTANVQGYGTPNAQSSQTATYNPNMTANQPPAATQTGTYTTNTANQSSTPSAYGSNTNQTPQNVPQANYSPSTTPAANQQTYPANNLVNLQNASVQQTMPMNQHQASGNSQNPYPNATGQNMAAYASGQYQYNGRPWYRPRFGSPQNSPYNSTSVPPPNAAPMSVPPPSANYNYWQES